MELLFSFYASYGCDSDYIRVYEGVDESGIFRANLCGTHHRYPPIVVGTGNLFVRFHSNGNYQFHGFQASFTASGDQALSEIETLLVFVSALHFGGQV